MDISLIFHTILLLRDVVHGTTTTNENTQFGGHLLKNNFSTNHMGAIQDHWMPSPALNKWHSKITSLASHPYVGSIDGLAMHSHG